MGKTLFDLTKEELTRAYILFSPREVLISHHESLEGAKSRPLVSIANKYNLKNITSLYDKGFLGHDYTIDKLKMRNESDLEKINSFDISTKDIVSTLNKVRNKINQNGKISSDISLKGYSEFNINFNGNNYNIILNRPFPFDYLTCPFTGISTECCDSNKGTFDLSFYTLSDNKNGKSFNFNDIGIHLIDEHSFFSGQDSYYRIDPEHFFNFFVRI